MWRKKSVSENEMVGEEKESRRKRCTLVNHSGSEVELCALRGCCERLRGDGSFAFVEGASID